MKTKPKIGDSAWFIEWCYELGFHDDEQEYVDRDACKNRRRKVDTKEQAYALAKEVWTKDDIANKLGCVEIWPATFRTWGDDEDAELYPSEGFWDADSESDYYEGD